MNIKQILSTSEFPKDYTVIDIETTGFSPVKDSIIEISALKVRNDKIIEEFSELVKPEGKISSHITHLTGISSNMVGFAPKIQDILPNFIIFLSDDVLLGHNIKFDINFIQTNLENCGYEKLKNQYTDTMKLARHYCKLKSHSLKNLALHYNVSISGHHRALNDCIITHNIYQNIKNEFGSYQR